MPWRFWRSPADQPRWARPALLIVTAMAGLAYAWRFDQAYLEPFYGGAARSMAMNVHNFFYGAADPWGTVSVDKLPGALWPQALSLRGRDFLEAARVRARSPCSSSTAPYAGGPVPARVWWRPSSWRAARS